MYMYVYVCVYIYIYIYYALSSYALAYVALIAQEPEARRPGLVHVLKRGGIYFFFLFLFYFLFSFLCFSISFIFSFFKRGGKY